MTSVVQDVGSPADWLALGDDPPSCWVRGGRGIVAWGEALRIDVGTGPDRAARAANALAEAASRASVTDRAASVGSGLIAIASFAFDEAGDSTMFVPRVVLGLHGDRRFRTDVVRAGAEPLPLLPASGRDRTPPSRPRFAGTTGSDVGWLSAVAEATRRIEAHHLDKVVLARDHLLWSERPFDVRGIVQRLWARFPSCHTFHVDGLVGATPELLLARHGDIVRSRVLAGTAARGADADADAAIGVRLLESQKDRAEHALAVASVVDVLGPRCVELDVRGPHLLRLDNVQHLATDVVGRLGPDRPTSLELVGALHPTAAVGGSPRPAALATIAELEGMGRGRYAGPVGWTDASGDGEWGIALRCAQIDGSRARLFAGAGIVAGSLPEEELAETRLKLAAMRGVLGDGPE